MNSTKRICASLVLLFGFLLTTALIKVYRANAANSFAAAQQDSPPSPVTYFDSKKLAETFTKGGVLSDWTGDNKNYRVSIYRIEKAPYTEYLGFEIHNLTTHIFYVLEGSGTIVTGGPKTLISPKTIAPNEIRGTYIEGGEDRDTRRIYKGDVIVVPKGVAHNFKEIFQSPFVLLEVDVR